MPRLACIPSPGASAVCAPRSAWRRCRGSWEVPESPAAPLLTRMGGPRITCCSLLTRMGGSSVARCASAEPHAAAQVAFNALIPCMLFTKVGATLAARPDPALLAIPLVAAAQVRSSG